MLLERGMGMDEEGMRSEGLAPLVEICKGADADRCCLGIDIASAISGSGRVGGGACVNGGEEMAREVNLSLILANGFVS